MKFILTLVVIALAAGGYNYWKHRSNRVVPVVSSPSVESDRGFAAMPQVEGQNARTVYVVAAQNCPREEGQRTDRLAADLARRGIPVDRTHSAQFSFNAQPDNVVMETINKIMAGPLPVVFVRGRAKSNPSLEEVVAEFSQGKK